MSRSSIPYPSSCDTFVVLPPGSNGEVIFGKNSDRIKTEVQEVVYRSSTNNDTSSKLKVTSFVITNKY